jgi:hypothetical protein
MAVEDRRTRAPGSRVGYAIVLLGAALFVATCFLPAPIGGNPRTRTFAELLIDCEEDRTLKAVLVGMLRAG